MESKIHESSDFSSAPSNVANIDEAVAAIKQVLLICDGLTNSDSLHTAFHKCTIIETLLLRTLPVPLPYEFGNNDAAATTPSTGCIWLSRSLMLSEQRDIIHDLYRLCKVYLSSYYSLEFSSFVSSFNRIITLAAIMTISDTIIRVVADDVASPITQVCTFRVYLSSAVFALNRNHCVVIVVCDRSSTVMKNCILFMVSDTCNGSGVDVALLTAGMECYDPYAAYARGQICSYFEHVNRKVKKKLFSYKTSSVCSPLCIILNRALPPVHSLI